MMKVSRIHELRLDSAPFTECWAHPKSPLRGRGESRVPAGGMEMWIVGRVNTKGSSSCSVQQGQLSRFGLCPALKLCPVH